MSSDADLARRSLNVKRVTPFSTAFAISRCQLALNPDEEYCLPSLVQSNGSRTCGLSAFALATTVRNTGDHSISSALAVYDVSAYGTDIALV